MSDSVQPHPWDSPGKNTGVGCHFLLQCRKVKSENEVTQLCPTLHDPMDCSLPGSSIHGIFQARVLEWGCHCLLCTNKCAVFSKNHNEVAVTHLCLTLCDPMDYIVHGILQARILDSVAFPFSRGSFKPRDLTQVSYITGRFFTS